MNASVAGIRWSLCVESRAMNRTAAANKTLCERCKKRPARWMTGHRLRGYCRNFYWKQYAQSKDWAANLASVLRELAP
jgi:hypothetical protein